MIKAVLGALVISLALCLAGCGSQKASPATESADMQSHQESATAEVGDIVNVTTKNGDLTVKVDAFEDNSKATSDELRYGHIKQSQHVGALKLVVKNISYENSSNHDLVDLSTSVHVIDDEGVSLNPMNGAFDLDEYGAAAGGLFQCPVGQSERVALFYPISPDLNEVTIDLAKTKISAPVIKAAQ